MIALEFSDKQQCFHINYGDPENTYGWRTIAKVRTPEEADEIINQLRSEVIGEREYVNVNELVNYLNVII